jgi:hypothetical protein
MTVNERLRFEAYREGEDNTLNPASNDTELSYGLLEDLYALELQEEDME